MKNQRLKTELISNVSHDLKTPLTSIITYIDLLKTEGHGQRKRARIPGGAGPEKQAAAEAYRRPL
ncbi:MAG: histidine kinase dimerization/phospho-acceptor domain-containing protein [Anaerovoracaceae bacterium]